MSNSRRIECFFVSSLAAVPGVIAGDRAAHPNSVYIELATQPGLENVYRTGEGARPGICALLTSPGAVDDARWWGRRQVPLVLADRPAASVAAIESAVAVLSTSPGKLARAVLIVAARDAADFEGAYDHVDSFSVWWDVADLPGKALATVAGTLATVAGWERARWGGFHLCSDPARGITDAQSRRDSMQRVMAQYPVLMQEQ